MNDVDYEICIAQYNLAVIYHIYGVYSDINNKKSFANDLYKKSLYYLQEVDFSLKKTEIIIPSLKKMVKTAIHVNKIQLQENFCFFSYNAEKYNLTIKSINTILEMFSELLDYYDKKNIVNAKKYYYEIISDYLHAKIAFLDELRSADAYSFIIVFII